MTKLIKTEGKVVANGQERRGKGELLVNGCRVSIMQNEKVQDFLHNSVYTVNNMVMNTYKLLRDLYNVVFVQ